MLDVNVVSAPPPPAACPQPKRFQLVGFTDSKFGGSAGLIAFANACQAEVDPNSRMCSSLEVIETVHFPDLSGIESPGFAYVRPVYQIGVSGVNDPVISASGISLGETNLELGTCRGWTQDGGSSLVVNAAGGFEVRSCDPANFFGPHRVACCAPR